MPDAVNEDAPLRVWPTPDGAQFVFVGLHTKLKGPKRVVQRIAFHDDHMHVRLRAGG